MGLNAIHDLKTKLAQVNWLLSQLKETKLDNIYVRVWHENAQQSQQVSHTVLRESSTAFVALRKEKILLLRFEITIAIDLIGKFFRSKKFIQKSRKWSLIFILKLAIIYELG